VRTSFHIAAPIDGVLTAFALKNGMNVTKSDAVAAVEGLDPLWVTASVPERYAPYLPQAKFKLSVDAFPGRIWEASAPTVLPEGEAATRTLKLRFSVDNPNLELRPGMTAKLLLAAPGAQGILVPSQAVIDDGRNPRVIVREGTRFIPKPVRILGESSGQTALASGVQPGEDVVVSGVFLIDSEANIEGALARMQPAADGLSANEGAAAPMPMPADPMKPASPDEAQSEPKGSMPQGMTHGAPDESLGTASKPQTVLDLSSPTPSAATQPQGAAK
ncbi:MAG: efflux RND transporter periplasmic adaptor subunit, partial [Sutterella wadsworthensis]